MANPRPRLENLKPIKPKGEKPLKGRIHLRCDPELEAKIRQIPEFNEWMRRVLWEAAQLELERTSSNS